ncbi:MAG TPA: preprotein translocase subunit SecY [Tissierellia bacterium]|jgi:preprotein translocase subunit SecY|nr:preprotein translocase subunit SecY [Tissierellia bacterium]
MFDTLKKAWRIPDLRKKIIFTLLMLVIFRLGANIPVPGVSREKLLAMAGGAREGFLGFFSLMSGGAFANFTMFALGISPYITATIVMQLLQIAIPSLEALSREGEAGRRKIAQYSRYLTVLLAFVQALALSLTWYRSAFYEFNFVSIAVAVLSLTAGTAFLMYLGEKINEHGIGNGISLFIFAGIVAQLPMSAYGMVFRVIAGQVNVLSLLAFLVVALLIIVGVIMIQEGSRKIPVQYSKRVVGRKMYGGHASNIPLKVNQTGVIPVIFAMSILMLPITLASFFPGSGFANWMDTYFKSSSILYNVFYVLLIIFFTYFYTSVTFNPAEIADNIKKSGGFIPGIRPGRPTENHISRTLNRLTIVGAIFLAIIASIPNIVFAYTSLGIRFGGTSLLIIVGVALETMKQIEAQMVMRHYKGFLR